jgi:PKD repeat protein
MLHFWQLITQTHHINGFQSTAFQILIHSILLLIRCNQHNISFQQQFLAAPPSFDSVMVFVNPLPVVQVSLASQNHNNICFLNNSDCADTYLWDFGDSTFSSDANPCHVYPDTGLFLVTLIACNSFGCDTFQRYIFVDSILISSLEDNNYSEEFEIFPNPANNNFTIKFNPIFETAPIEIYNTYGACVYTSSVSGNCKSINFNLPTGVYIVRLIANKRMISRRIVIF